MSLWTKLLLKFEDKTDMKTLIFANKHLIWGKDKKEIEEKLN
jgi:hypothetical protein